MRTCISLLFLSLCFNSFVFGQDSTAISRKNQKGKIYLYWGYNRAFYSKSDITFTGEGYDFELKDVKSVDRQSPLRADIYLDPAYFTIPQYNFRIGYFINDLWNISLGFDHMKYIVRNDQMVKIDGTIANTQSSYNGSYSDDDIDLSDDFIEFEHTDGLNYINLEMRSFQHHFSYKRIDFSTTEGITVGGLLPKTNAQIFDKQRNDTYHWAGFGLGIMCGVNLTFYNHIFIQGEMKLGYINMPDILTTVSGEDRASQSFYYSQFNVVIGGIFSLIKPKSID